MAKVQTRRSISVSKAAFEEAQNVAMAAGESLSKFTERALRKQIDTSRVAGPIARVAVVDTATGTELVDGGEVTDVRVEYDE